jgi:hypothetical protein
MAVVEQCLVDIIVDGGESGKSSRRRSLLDEGGDVMFDMDALISSAFLAHWRVGAL